MRCYVLLAAFFFASLFSYAQDNKGYYVTNNDVRVEGYFKSDNFSNPDNLEFKKNTSDNFDQLELQALKEYGVDGQYRMVKMAVKVDKSMSSSVRMYSNYKEPDWQKETLFLNVIVDGDASLYSCVYNGENKFFYQVKSKQIGLNQLVYKKYVFNNSGVKENTAYQQDLYNNVNCEGANINFGSVSYTESSLKRVFETYNKCLGSDYAVYENKGASKLTVSFSAFAGGSFSIFKYNGKEVAGDSDSKLGVNVGTEVEFVMSHTKLGGFARLEYTNVSDGKLVNGVSYTNRITEVTTLDANFLNFTVGPRFYLNELKNKKGLYFDGGVGMSFAFGDMIGTQYTQVNNVPSEVLREEFSLTSTLFLSAGAGYSINEKLGIDVRYDFPKDLTDKVADYKFSRFALNFKYTFN
ncbi:hypothetical protein [Flavobacterium beibuense]|uniref:hypothetical protein n=1 Tax=Flavobacterium beibuense TaxID=657326 RepID=UPI003A94C7DC